MVTNGEKYSIDLEQKRIGRYLLNELEEVKQILANTTNPSKIKSHSYNARPLKLSTKHLEMSSPQRNNQTKENSENKRELLQEIRKNVNNKFDQNTENENKHKSQKGNIQKKFIPSLRSRFNSSNKTNVSISLGAKDDIKPTPRRENQGSEYKLQPRILGRGRVFYIKNRKKADLKTNFTSNYTASFRLNIQRILRKESIKSNPDFKKFIKTMIIKSNSGGNLEEDNNKNKFSYRNKKDENDLEYSSKFETSLRKRGRLQGNSNKREITHFKKQVQLITQNEGARSGQQSRKQRINPCHKQNLPKASVISDIIDITNFKGKTKVMQNCRQSLRKHTNGHTSAGSSTAPSDYKVLLNRLRGQMLES